jgi:hypothetical protein
MMARGGVGPDFYRSQDSQGGGGSGYPHRPKTPTAQDMTQRSKTPMPTSHSYGGGDLRASGRYTPNPNMEFGRYGRAMDFAHSSGRAGANGGWPDFSSPPAARRFDPFENPSHNRSYGGELSRTMPSSLHAQNSPRGANNANMPVRQSTSFETEHPTPGDLTRMPRRTPFSQGPANAGGLSPRSPSRGPGSDGGQGEGGVSDFTVTLYRQESGYGFRIIGGTEEGSQVSIYH